jgi:hypothetical protein
MSLQGGIEEIAPKGREQQSLGGGGTDHPPGNNDLLSLTRLNPSSDVQDNNFSDNNSGTPPKTRTELIMISLATPVTEPVYAYTLP